MDQQRLTTWTRSLSGLPSRRDVLRGLAGAGLGLSELRLSDVAAAKNTKKGKKRKRKKQIQTPTSTPPFELPPLAINRFGCVDAGQACRGDNANCCSGVCQGAAPAPGQPDTSRCVAHNASICKAGSDICATGNPGHCDEINLNCRCRTTTGNAGFCGDFTDINSPDKLCRVCARDTDCQAEFGPGAACAVFEGICSKTCASTGGTACLRPCP